MRWYWIAVPAVIVLGALVLPRGGETGLLTVTGRGEAAAAPDMATITLGTVTLAETAEEAMARNGGATRATLETLAAAGVEAADVRTSGPTLRPIRSRKPPDASGNSAPRIDGYEARNTITARVFDLASLGEVLDAAVSAGANEFRSLSFGLTDPAPLASEARRMAVAEAREAAELLADAAGVDLGAMVSLDLADDRGPPAAAAREGAFASAGVPVAEGEITVGAGVTIVWETH